MDCMKVGKLILQLRTEKGLTQKQVADQLNISNKTISKWECGLGCPDVSLWEELANVLGADILKLLQGELTPNRPDVGKLNRIQFYVCPVCGNILTSTGAASIACCGRQLQPLIPNIDAPKHTPQVEEVDAEYYATVQHEMRREHYLLFAACVNDDRIWLNRFYPEQSPNFRFPNMRGGGSLYLYCTEHGLIKYELDILLNKDRRLPEKRRDSYER